MLNKPSVLRMVGGIFFAAFFSLSVAALTFKEVQPGGATVPAVPAEPLVSSDAAATAPPGKVVYKSVDANGNTIFTDIPPVNRPSEAIKVQSANTMPARQSVSSESSEEEQAGSVVYTRLEITSPANDEVLGQEIEFVTLAAQLEPPLQEGDVLQLYYDGKPVGDGSSSHTVTELERGTHTVEAKIFDKKKKLLKTSPSIQFHVRRISSLNSLTAKPLPSKGVSGPQGGYGGPKGARSPGDSGGASGMGSIHGASSAGDATGANDISGRSDTKKK